MVDCKVRCGKCCLEYHSMSISDNDIKRWEEEGRYDLLFHPLIDTDLGDIFQGSEMGQTINEIRKDLHELEDEYWENDSLPLKFLFNNRMYVCPFLKIYKKTYSCMIQETKPDVCRNFKCTPNGFPHNIK